MRLLKLLASAVSILPFMPVAGARPHTAVEPLGPLAAPNQTFVPQNVADNSFGPGKPTLREQALQRLLDEKVDISTEYMRVAGNSFPAQRR